MAVSIITCNFNGARFLPKLLGSLKQQQGVETEIIVVDRNSTDGSYEILASQSGLKIIQEPPETGLVAGYTAGVRIAKYEHFFFCNGDMWFDPQCLKFLEAQIDLSKRICAADPWQWTYDGSQWIRGGVRFKRSLKAIASPFVLPFLMHEHTVFLNSDDKVPLACAGAFLIHRDVFEELGGWDTSFFLFHEDTDLFIRAWQRGWFCLTTPQARVYHAAGSSVQNPNLKPSIRRQIYISRRTNTLIIAVKYFSFFYIPITFIPWIAIFICHILRLRFRLVTRDILILKQFFKRLPPALKFRTKNTQWNCQKPGEKFYKDPEFVKKET